MWATLAAWLQKSSSSSSPSPSPHPQACPWQKNCSWLGFDLARLYSLDQPTCSPVPSPPPPSSPPTPPTPPTPPLMSSWTSPGQWTRGWYGSTQVLFTQNHTAPPLGNINPRQGTVTCSAA